MVGITTTCGAVLKDCSIRKLRATALSSVGVSLQPSSFLLAPVLEERTFGHVYSESEGHGP